MGRALLKHLAAVALAAVVALAPAAAGTPVLVVNPGSGVERITRDQAIDIFMGRQKRLPSGIVALPVEQANPPAIRACFYRSLVNMDILDVNAYWARLFYSGQAQPPRLADSAEEVLEVVAMNRGAIGVMDKSMVDRRVRVVLDLNK